MSFSNYFGGDPCAVPASKECEAHKCPHFWSDSPIPVGSKECRNYMRDKRRGALTTVEELERAKRVKADVTSVVKQRGAITTQTNEALALRQKREQELDKGSKAESSTKKFFLIGGIALVVAATAYFFRPSY